MPPFRFLQVAGLDLDTIIPRPPVELARLCESDPFDALERIVEAAIERDVDGVLFSPAIGRDGLPEVLGLPALESLHDLIDSLHEQGIAVIVAVGGNIPFWRRLVGRGSRTSLLTPGDRIAFHDRHDRLCAELHGLDSLPTSDLSSHDSGFTIGVAPTLGMADLEANLPRGYDYLALGEGPRESRRFDRSLAHCPGAPRATNTVSVGSHGITLVNVDGAGVIQTEFLATASVRFETFTIVPETDAILDDLALGMMETLNSRPVETSEKGWIVSWTIRAAGGLLARLESHRGRSELLALLPHRHEDRIISHRLTIAPASTDATDIPFATEFNEALRERRALMGSVSQREALVGSSTNARHHHRMRELLAECGEQDVLDQAQWIGLRLATAAAEDIE